MKLKVCLVGDESVGKTSLANRYADNSFSEKYKSTVGVKIFDVERDFNAETFHFMVWDIQGGEDMYTKNRIYYKGAFAHIIMCDVCNPKSIKNLTFYFKSSLETYSSANIYIAFNKTDLEYDAAPVEEAIKDLSSLGLSNDRCFYTSAKTGKAVEALLEKVTQDYIKFN